jgi:hypothetical protein
MVVVISAASYRIPCPQQQFCPAGVWITNLSIHIRTWRDTVLLLGYYSTSARSVSAELSQSYAAARTHAFHHIHFIGPCQQPSVLVARGNQGSCRDTLVRVHVDNLPYAQLNVCTRGGGDEPKQPREMQESLRCCVRQCPTCHDRKPRTTVNGRMTGGAAVTHFPWYQNVQRRSC